MANTYELIIKTVDQSSRPLNNIQKNLGRTEKSALGVQRAIRAAGAAVAAFAGSQIIGGIIRQYREYEKYSTVLSTFLGSQQAATRELARLQVLANSLPQDLADITNAFTILSRFGIDTSAESLRAFSNIATANAKSFSQLGEAVADALTGEFERLKEFGIRVARENGKFVASIGGQQVAVANSTQDLVTQIKALGEEGGRFGGAAAANANTLDQSYSNLNGAIFETAVAFGQALKPALRETIDLTSQLLRDNEELTRALGAGTGAALRTLAGAFQVVAANIEIVRQALLLLIFTRVASGLATIVNRIAQFTAGAKTASGFASGLAAAIRGVGTGVGQLILRLTGLRGAFVFLATLTPIGRLIAVGFALASAAALLFRDRVFEIGGTTTTISEIVRAFAFKAKQLFIATANVLGEAWGNAVSQVSGYFSSLGIDVGGSLRAIGGFALDVVNATIGYFVLANKSIVAIFTTLPEFFGQVFLAIGATAKDFGARVVAQFSNIGEALKMAITAPFTDATFEDALRTLNADAFDGFLEGIQTNFSDTATVIDNALREAADTITYDYIENGLGAVGTAIESTVLDFRAYNDAVAAAEALTREYDDAVLRQARGLGILGDTVGGAAEQLSQYEEFLRNANSTIADSDAQIQILNTTIQAAVTAFQNGAINAQQFASVIDQVGAAATAASVDILTMDSVLANAITTGLRTAETSQLNAEALAYLNENSQALGLTGEALIAAQKALGMEFERTGGSATKQAEEIATVATTYRDALEAITEFGNKQELISGAMEQLIGDFGNGRISLDQLGIAMETIGATMSDLKGTSIDVGLSMIETFERAGESLGRGLSKSIIEGKSVMENFRNFMSTILQEILFQVIQKQFIDPMISTVTNGLGQAFSAFASGGLGAFFGGGGLIGGIFGAIGSIFGFANGGIVPGRPTSGDSVPIMATPGEVILNKGQQQALIEGGSSEQPVTVNFQINAIDTQSGTEFLLNKREEITALIQQAYRQRGKSGPLG